MNKCPCHNCEERKPHCHSTCEEYIEYAKQRADLNEKKHAEKSKRQKIIEYEIAKHKRLK